MRVLLVEDDPMIGNSIQQGLRHDGFTVDWVQDGTAAELALRTAEYAVLLLDLGLPQKSGLAVLTTLRRAGNAIHILILRHERERLCEPAAGELHERETAGQDQRPVQAPAVLAGAWACAWE